MRCPSRCLPRRYKDPAALPAYFSALIETARAAPGVKAVTLGTPPPRESAGRFVAERVERSGGAALLTAGPNYFAVLGIPLLAGRAFNAEDRRGSMPVAIVDDTAAELLLAW